MVAALFGLPVIFLYAAAWALLPDVDGRVHVRDLLCRDYQPVQWGILAMAVIGLFPTAPLAGRLFGLGYDGWSALSLISWILGLVLVASLLFLIVRAASRTPARPWRAAGGPGASLALTPPAPPVPLPPGSQDPAALEAWRAQHAAWKEQDQAWRRQQQDVERAARDQLRRERQAEAAVFAAEAAERRRIRRASNPRAGFAFAATMIGLAIITGAAVGLVTGGESLGGALGLLAAALILALGMIVAGAFRRRSGFLAFATVLTLMGGLVAGAFSTLQGFTPGWASISNNRAEHISQPFGDLYLSLNQHDGAPRPIVIEKGSGTTEIYVDAGVELELRATLDTGTAHWTRVEGETATIIDSGIWSFEDRGGESVIVQDISSDRVSATTVQPVTIDQTSGAINVTIYEPVKEDQ